MTKKEFFATVITNYPVDVDSYVDVVTHARNELDKLETPRKPTAKQQENQVLQETIFMKMAENKSYTIKEIQEFEECAELSNQKISAMMKALVQNNKVSRIVTKEGTSFMKIVE